MKQFEITDINLADLEIWEIAEMCELDEEQEEILKAALDAGFSVEDAINYIFDGGCRLYDAYDYSTLAEEILFEELHRKDLFSNECDPFLEHIAEFIDYERYGRAYCINNDCYFTKYGVLEIF